jgi:DNA-binding HxlR family transcriptional regulator/putative sterol carrier protein
MLGPKRYKDLLGGLPGIGTNLLAMRLRELEEIGLVERGVLPPPAGSAVYQLTEAGLALEPVLAAIGRWGSRFLGPVRENDTLVPSAYFLAMRSTFRPELAVGLTETYELRIGEQVFEVRIEDQRCSTSEGRAARPDVIMTMPVETLNAFFVQGLDPAEAVASGQVEIQGDASGLGRFVNMFAFRRPAETAPSTSQRS